MQYGIVLLTLLSLGAFGGMQEGKKVTNHLQKLMEDGKYVKVIEVVDLSLFGDQNEPVMNPNWVDEKNAEELSFVLRFRIAALENLNRSSEIDDFMEKFTSVYGESWRALQVAAAIWNSVDHHGRVVAGKFYRGNQQRNGEYASAFERDRIRALQLMTQAAEKVKKETDPIARGWFYIDFAEFIQNGRGGNYTSWELQDLTDIKTLPDADTENPWSEGRRSSQVEGTPVNEDGTPLIFAVPESFETAKSDGERWRWALAESGKCQNETIAKLFRDEETYRLAIFYQRQFGEQTLAQIWDRFASATGDETQEEMTRESSLLQLETLSDSETIARTATGIRRFTMPDGANYIQIFKDLASRPGRFQKLAYKHLAMIAMNRRQYPHAVELFSQMNAVQLTDIPAEFHKMPYNGMDFSDWTNTITGNWARFEPLRQQTSENPMLRLRFRNAKKASFTAVRLDLEKLEAALKNAIREAAAKGPVPQGKMKTDFYQFEPQNLVSRLIYENKNEFVTNERTTWDVALEPAENFKDRSIETPLKVNGPGAYFVEMKLENGNSACIVAWIQDVMIATKRLDDATWCYVADSRTGKAIPGAVLEFTGWRKEWLENKDSRRRDLVQVFKNEVKAQCDENGTWQATTKNLEQGFQYFISAKRPGGERIEAFFGLHQSHFNYGRARHDDFWDQISAYGMTDRPIYRPEQTVHYKFWFAQALYDLHNYWETGAKKGDGAEEKDPYEPMEPYTMANADMTLVISSPNGDDVEEIKVKTNEYGGVSGDYELAKDAKLGQYLISLWDSAKDRCYGRITFRMEEYRKPEFEVTVDAPKEPVMLGDTMKVGVTSKYYFGAPVANGTVKYRVLRETYNTRWYAPAPWDWLYGPGYWWYTENYGWFPGWRRWGCLAPEPPWYRNHGSDEELVLEGEIKLTPEMEGKAEITVDTSIAAALYGNSDHQYRIVADVEDASRRVITGEGTVLAARSPFKVNVWTRRAWLEVGDQIPVSFAAKTLDGKPVKGSAKVHVFALSYDEKGTPNQKELQTADVVLTEDGMANYTLKATQSGQFRVACVVTSEGENPKTVEGATILTVRGQSFTGSDLRFNDLEIIPDRSEYKPGDVVKLMINTNQPDATVVLFERAQDGYCSAPRYIQMHGKSQLVELPVRHCDQPNFFIEALTTAKSEVYAVTKEICVPPEKRILNLEVIPVKDRFLPGEKAEVTLRLTDQYGKPFVGETVLTVYDKSLEYISGGSNISDIYRHFWSWKRNHYPETQSTTFLNSGNMQKPGSSMMSDLGRFWYFQLYGDLRDGFGVRIGQDGGVFLRKSKSRGRMLKSMARRMDADEDGMVVEEAEAEMLMDAAPMPAAAPAPEMAMGMMRMEKAAGMAMANGAKQSPQSELKTAEGKPGSDKAKEEKKLVAATIRKNFADTAYWSASLVTDEKGEARVEFPMPENLTTWKVCAWAMGAGTRVGKAETQVVTAKNLILRMQTPRFITTSDELLLTANVHNYLATEKKVVVSIDLGDSGTAALKSEKTVTVTVPPKGESRVDWLVRAENEGKLVVTMTAQTDEESDAMQLSVPVQIHGMAKQDARSGMIPSAKLSELTQDSAAMEFTIPEARRPKDSALEIRYSPTLAGAMLDAIPYLVEYPYGCTEQTLNRFLPAVLARKALTDAGVDLDEIAGQTNNLNAQEIGDPKKRAEQWKKLHRDRASDPVFNDEKFHEILSIGVDRLVNMQCADGGWGWFSGSGEHSTPHLTALVTRGLLLAQQAEVFGELENSEAVERSIQSGIAWLMREQREEVAELRLWVEYFRWLESWRKEHRDPKHPEVDVNPKREEIPAKYRDADMKSQVSEMDVLVFATLAQAGVSSADMNEMSNFIFRDRVKLSTQSNALAGIAFFQREEKDRFRTVFEYLTQFLVRDAENQTAHLSLPSFCYWWYWYGNDIETQAAYLRLLCLDGRQESLEKAAWIVKYLLNNRKNATYWSSTRDTAQVLEAFTQYLRTTNELAPQMKVDVLLDGEVKKTVEITPENLFTADLTYLLEGEAVTTGTHKVELRRTGDGPLYFNGYARYFTLEDFIPKTGLEVKVERKYFRLQRVEATQNAADTHGKLVKQNVVKYERIPMKSGEAVTSGDLVEVELTIESKNDYSYILIEDMKPAGFETVDAKSGYNGNALHAYVEYRDNRVCFFVQNLREGIHSVTYRMRAETPGKVSALPTRMEAMYAPELKANSDEMKIECRDKE